MRTTRITLSALLLAGASSIAAAAQPPAPALMQPALNAAIAVGVGFHGTVGVDSFYSNLAPYGYWVNRPSYGWVWLPRHIRHGWRPYSSGRWAYTDYGWTWVSSEPYGWATYHYGRWNLDPDYGWAWVPGTDWGPAWVSWQEGNGYCGWAPLPPAVGWSAGAGLDLGGFNLAVGIDPGWYSFVPERSFLAVNVGGYIVPPNRNVEIFRNTTNITNYRVDGGRVFNGSVPVQRIAQVTGQPVRQLRLANASDPRVARVSGNSVALFRPAAVVRQANAPDPARVAPRSVLTGRAAQQLAQQRRSEAAQFRLAGNAGSQGQAARSANANARAAQNPAGRNAAGMTPASRAQQQAQARRQAAPAGRQAQQAVGRNGRGQVTSPPQRTRGGTPPRTSARVQQGHQSMQAQGAGRTPAAQRAPAGRQQRQALGHNSRSQVTPPPQRTRGGTPPRTGARAQQAHGYAPPPQRQQQSSRPSAPPQRQQQVTRQSAPPQRQAQFQRQGPPPQAQRQAAPPTRQAPPQRQAPAPRQQQRRQQGPPPPAGGV
jgi:uncharacterized protein DUF6600